MSEADPRGGTRGDEWAIACLFRAMQPQLFCYLTHHAPDAAEDLASETWLSAARLLSEFEGSAQAAGAPSSQCAMVLRSRGAFLMTKREKSQLPQAEVVGPRSGDETGSMSLPPESGFRDGSVPTDLLDNRYRFERLIGRGGMGAVYRATDTRLGREVAIKVLLDNPGSDRSRFAAEVRTLARFSHPNLVSVLDVALLDGRPCLVMELIDGPNLAEHLRDGPIALPAVATIGAGVASALDYVHSAGIVHRDVKPANVLLDSRWQPHLADFGIARLVDISTMTATGMTLGTLAYLAPEQVLSASVGPAADMYSLGLVLLECLTGTRAFTGTPQEITAARLHREPEIPLGVLAEWRSLITALVARSPDARPSASEARSALEHLTHNLEPVTLLPMLPAEVETRLIAVPAFSPLTERLDLAPVTATLTRPAVDIQDVESGEPPGGGARRSPSQRRVLIAALAVALAAVAVLLVMTGLPGSAPTPTPSGAGGSTTTTVAQPTSTTVTTVVPTTLPSLTTAAGSFAAALQAGVGSGDVDASAAQQLDALVQSVQLPSPPGSSVQQIAVFDQLAQTLSADEANGLVTGATTTAALQAAEAQIATALGTTVPAPTTVPVTTTTGGKGHGHGHGGN